MLRVSYSNPLGYVEVYEYYKDAEGNPCKATYKFDLCFVNMNFFAEIEKVGNGDNILHMFFMDNDHLKRIVSAEGKNAPLFLKGRHYYFNSFYRVATPVTVELLNRLGAKVSFYYKNPNKKK